MEVLELSRTYLVLLGVCSTTNTLHRILFRINYFLVLLLQILGLIASIWFIITFIKTDLNSVLYAGFHTSAYSTSTYSLLVGFVYDRKMTMIFETLQCIFDKCE